MKLKNVDLFLVTPNDLYWIDTNEVVYKNNTEIGSAVTYSNLIYHNNTLYAIDGINWKTFPPRMSYDFDKQILSIQGNNIIFNYGKFMDETYGIALLSKDNQISILFETRKIQIETITENILIGRSFKGLSCLNFNDEILWEFPLEQLGELPYSPGETDTIEKILGVVHGYLWFYTRAGRLVALDIETGRIRKIFSYLEEDKERGAEVNEGLGDVYLHGNKNIYCIGYNVFTIIDTEKCDIIERYKTKEADPTGVGTYKSVFNPLLQGNYFTFIGEKENETNGCGWAGVFDYKAHKLVWECEIITQDERSTTGNKLIAPQRLFLGNNKLYIKDFYKNLHIFEVDL